MKPPQSPPKKMNKFKSFILGKRSKEPANKLAKKLSSVGIVEELFEEGSAMLAERFVPIIYLGVWGAGVLCIWFFK